MRLICAVLIAMLALGPAPLDFENLEAKACFERAGELYASQDYEGASDQLRQAYELEPRPTLLYSRAQVERMLERWAEAAKLYDSYLLTDVPEEKRVHARRHGLFSRAQAARAEGDCERAVWLYDEYVEGYPGTDHDEEAKAGRDACTQTLAQERAIEPAPPLEPAAPSDAVTTPRERPITDARESIVAPWYRSVAGGVLAGVGVAGLATGATLVGLAYRDRRLAQDEPTHDGSAVRFGRARQRETAGAIVLSLAGASLVFAGLAYGLSARRGRNARLAARPGGLAVRF